MDGHRVTEEKNRVESNRSGIRPWKILCVGLVMVLFGSDVSSWAQDQTGSTQEQVFVYVHTVATRVRIAVNNLTIYETGPVFGVWNYQFNMSSWLDTEPQKLSVNARFGNRDTAYCAIEVRRILADKTGAATVLAEKTIYASKTDRGSRDFQVISLDIARAPGNVRPLWAEHDQVELQPVVRKKSVDLVKETFDAIQSCQFEKLMLLIGPALTNQARMEGADPQLVGQSFLAMLQRHCIPSIPVAESTQAFSSASYENIMAPLDFEKIVYRFSLDKSRKDERGNLFTPVHPIVIKNRNNERFVARPYLSYADAKRKSRFVSRFVFERIE